MLLVILVLLLIAVFMFTTIYPLYREWQRFKVTPIPTASEQEFIRYIYQWALMHHVPKQAESARAKFITMYADLLALFEEMYDKEVQVHNIDTAIDSAVSMYLATE